jgi:DNA-binding LacI/PurR family transcriptional regulator
MAVTMKDIAMLAGVSRQAVSAVLNGNGSSRVSEENRQKILRISKEVNYIPNIAARSLKGGPTRTIGLLGRPYVSILVSALVNEIASILHAQGYTLLSCEYNSSVLSPSTALTELLSRGVDGIIITNSDDRHVLEKNQQVPYVFCSHNNASGYDVGIDNVQGGYIAARHLIEHGRKRICFLTIAKDDDNLKLKGMVNALSEAKIEIDSKLFFNLRDMHGLSSNLIAKLRRLRVDAVFCNNDYIAAKLIAVLLYNGIKVPEEIAVIGYDGHAFGEFAAVPLTTVVQQVRQQAEIATEILLRRINNNSLGVEPENINLSPKLYCASSCGCKRNRLDRMFTINSFSMLEKNLKMNFDIDILNSNS